MKEKSLPLNQIAFIASYFPFIAFIQLRSTVFIQANLIFDQIIHQFYRFHMEMQKMFIAESQTFTLT